MNNHFGTTCFKKTNLGNVFSTRAHAKRAAKRLGKMLGKTINSFECACCGHWHIGSRSKHRQRKAQENQS